MKILIASIFALVAIYLGGDADLGLRLVSWAGLPNDAFSSSKVWIVGASGGIGASLALELASRGATLALSSRRVDELEKVATKCRELGATVVIVPMDVLKDDHEAIAERILKEFDIDSVVLNAGRSQRQLALHTDLQTTRDIMELNFFTYVSLAKVASKFASQIVVTSSVSGKLGTPGGSSYSASKFALHGYFDALRMENDVNVLLVCPGPVVSDIGKNAYGVKALDYVNKMPTERCTFLMAVAMYWRFDEVWISKQPELLYTLIAQYTPRLFHVLGKSPLGQSRVQQLKQRT